MNAKTGKQPDAVVIKKYANRRLYDTETSMYITLEDLAKRVKKGQDFVVIDAKTGENLTRHVLTQIILEREVQGNPLLPVEFLRGVISFYDDKMHNVLQNYLEASMKAFIGNQERMRGMMAGAAPAGKQAEGFASPFAPFEEMTRQNVAFFEKAFSMFTPFGNYFGEEEESDAGQQPAAATAKRSRR